MIRRAVCIFGLTILTLTGLGCQRVLFPKNAPRTQFELHDRMRSQDVPLEEPDVFGTMRPALRARLSQS